MNIDNAREVQLLMDCVERVRKINNTLYTDIEFSDVMLYTISKHYNKRRIEFTAEEGKRLKAVIRKFFRELEIEYKNKINKI